MTKKHAKTLADDIIDTMREPIIALRQNLSVQSANSAFYQHFQVLPEDTIDRQVYDLGNGQWNIPRLRELLESVLPNNQFFNDYEVQHTFESLGPRTMLLNARRIDDIEMILLAVEDITERKEAQERLRRSEESYRSLAELNPDAILVKTDGRLSYANPTAVRLLGVKNAGDMVSASQWRRDETMPESDMDQGKKHCLEW
jgi:nitrogen-specific signal transduction histidine kinase